MHHKSGVTGQVGWRALRMLLQRGYTFHMQARLCHEKGDHQCQRIASLCLQDLRRLGLLNTWPQHLRTRYQQYQRDI